jgi:hypothetical protein
MGGDRSLLMDMVWVWVQIRRKMLGSHLMGCFLMGNAQLIIRTCILHPLSSRMDVLALDDLMQICCLSLRRWSEPPYLAKIYLANAWKKIVIGH